MNINKLMTLAVIGVAVASLSSYAAPDPETVFRNPPQSAKTGVWWHWMGCNVSKEGIVKDLDWFKETGIGAATIFGMADVCSPWATKIKNSPNEGLIAFTPDWWKLVRFACEEAEKRGIEIGVHNCPGYTSTGGPWIPPRLSMRELVFNVTNAEAQISLTAHAAFPVQVGEGGPFKKPDIPSRRTDLQEIAVVEGVRVQHIPMGSFTQPNQWETFGVECDKMNPEAVAFHMDKVIGDMKKYVGDQIGRGLKFVLLDSYEAGWPSWTPNMRAEFKTRRGYDPLPYLPILGGFKVSVAKDKAAEKKFRDDFKLTIRELYRDVFFKIIHEKLSAVGLEMACEPYGGPIDTRMCAGYVDRLMTEFWYRPNLNRKVPGRLGWDQWTGPGGKRHNVVEAEAFTGSPGACNWIETPYLLKAAGDTQFYCGINRMTLHTCPLQPWPDEFLPGKVMGRWGTHFGRTQTWAKSGKGFYTYLNRCQALLQWGEPSKIRIIGHDITPKGTSLTAHAREADGTVVFFVMNHSDHPASMNMGLPNIGKAPEWFDPVTGTVPASALRHGLPRAAQAGRFACAQRGQRLLPEARQTVHRRRRATRRGTVARDLRRKNNRYAYAFRLDSQRRSRRQVFQRHCKVLHAPCCRSSAVECRVNPYSRQLQQPGGEGDPQRQGVRAGMVRALRGAFRAGRFEGRGEHARDRVHKRVGEQAHRR